MSQILRDSPAEVRDIEVHKDGTWSVVVDEEDEEDCEDGMTTNDLTVRSCSVAGASGCLLKGVQPESVVTVPPEPEVISVIDIDDDDEDDDDDKSGDRDIVEDARERGRGKLDDGKILTVNLTRSMSSGTSASMRGSAGRPADPQGKPVTDSNLGREGQSISAGRNGTEETSTTRACPLGPAKNEISDGRPGCPNDYAAAAMSGEGPNTNQGSLIRGRTASGLSLDMMEQPENNKNAKLITTPTVVDTQDDDKPMEVWLSDDEDGSCPVENAEGIARPKEDTTPPDTAIRSDGELSDNESTGSLTVLAQTIDLTIESDNEDSVAVPQEAPSSEPTVNVAASVGAQRLSSLKDIRVNASAIGGDGICDGRGPAETDYDELLKEALANRSARTTSDRGHDATRHRSPSSPFSTRVAKDDEAVPGFVQSIEKNSQVIQAMGQHRQKASESAGVLVDLIDVEPPSCTTPDKMETCGKTHSVGGPLFRLPFRSSSPVEVDLPIEHSSDLDESTESVVPVTDDSVCCLQNSRTENASEQQSSEDELICEIDLMSPAKERPNSAAIRRCTPDESSSAEAVIELCPPRQGSDDSFLEHSNADSKDGGDSISSCSEVEISCNLTPPDVPCPDASNKQIIGDLDTGEHTAYRTDNEGSDLHASGDSRDPVSKNSRAEPPRSRSSSVTIGESNDNHETNGNASVGEASLSAEDDNLPVPCPDWAVADEDLMPSWKLPSGPQHDVPDQLPSPEPSTVKPSPPDSVVEKSDQFGAEDATSDGATLAATFVSIDRPVDGTDSGTGVEQGILPKKNYSELSESPSSLSAPSVPCTQQRSSSGSIESSSSCGGISSSSLNAAEPTTPMTQYVLPAFRTKTSCRPTSIPLSDSSAKNASSSLPLDTVAECNKDDTCRSDQDPQTSRKRELDDDADAFSSPEVERKKPKMKDPAGNSSRRILDCFLPDDFDQTGSSMSRTDITGNAAMQLGDSSASFVTTFFSGGTLGSGNSADGSGLSGSSGDNTGLSTLSSLLNISCDVHRFQPKSFGSNGAHLMTVASNPKSKRTDGLKLTNKSASFLNESSAVSECLVLAPLNNFPIPMWRRFSSKCALRSPTAGDKYFGCTSPLLRKSYDAFHRGSCRPSRLSRRKPNRIDKSLLKAYLTGSASQRAKHLGRRRNVNLSLSRKQRKDAAMALVSAPRKVPGVMDWLLQLSHKYCNILRKALANLEDALAIPLPHMVQSSASLQALPLDAQQGTTALQNSTPSRTRLPSIPLVPTRRSSTFRRRGLLFQMSMVEFFDGETLDGPRLCSILIGLQQQLSGCGCCRCRSEHAVNESAGGHVVPCLLSYSTRGQSRRRRDGCRNRVCRIIACRFSAVSRRRHRR